jgi:hypothetical protein
MRSLILVGLLALGLLRVVATPLADTVGRTSRDRQMHGPAVRYVVNDTLSGIHLVWKDGIGEIRYNFRPRGGSWRWPAGSTVNPLPRNLGCLDVDVTTGRAVISADRLGSGSGIISQFTDSAAGVGYFVESDVALDHRHGLVAAANYGYTRQLAVRNDTLFFRSILASFRLGRVGGYPTFNVAASKQSGRYGCVWAVNDGPDAGRIYFRQTPNSGGQWYPLVSISDSLPSLLNRSLNSGACAYDSIRVHVALETYDGADVLHSQIWYYCPYDTPAYYRVRDCRLPSSARLGLHSLAAGRPSVALSRDRKAVFVVWEEFDTGNVDSVTGLARADIWAARSPDYGRTWHEPRRLTEPDETSKRFPFVAEVVDDTLHIVYFADRRAGLWENGEGEPTDNAVVYLRVPASYLPAVADAAPPGRPVTRAATVSRALTGRPIDAAGRTASARPAAGVYFESSPGVPPRRLLLIR